MRSWYCLATSCAEDNLYTILPRQFKITSTWLHLWLNLNISLACLCFEIWPWNRYGSVTGLGSVTDHDAKPDLFLFLLKGQRSQSPECLDNVIQYICKTSSNLWWNQITVLVMVVHIHLSCFCPLLLPVQPLSTLRWPPVPPGATFCYFCRMLLNHSFYKALVHRLGKASIRTFTEVLLG